MTSTDSILDPDLVRQVVARTDIVAGAELRAKKRSFAYPEAFDWMMTDGELHGAGTLVLDLATGAGPALAVQNRYDQARRVVECLLGFAPDREPGLGYEPPRPPAAYDANPLGFTAYAIDAAIDLLLHPAGVEAVTARLAANVVFDTRNRGKPIDLGGGRRYYPIHDDLARARRMLEVVAIPREEIPT